MSLSETQSPSIDELINESMFSCMPDELLNVPEFFRAHRGFRSGTIWDVWHVSPVEDIEAGVCQGVAFADQLVRCAKANRDPDIIRHVQIVLLIRIARGSLRFGPVECAFFGRLGHLAYRAAHD
jgi:hypothetical protein